MNSSSISPLEPVASLLMASSLAIGVAGLEICKGNPGEPMKDETIEGIPQARAIDHAWSRLAPYCFLNWRFIFRSPASPAPIDINDAGSGTDGVWGIVGSVLAATFPVFPLFPTISAAK